MEYYLALKKKKEIPQYVKTWMNLEDILLSETSQSQDNYCMIPLRVSKWIDSNNERVKWGGGK